MSSKVCRDFQRGNCTRGEHECRYAHPDDRSMIDLTDNSVTVCMDCIKGRCTRDKCKYFHPPPHLQVGTYNFKNDSVLQYEVANSSAVTLSNRYHRDILPLSYTFENPSSKIPKSGSSDHILLNSRKQSTKHYIYVRSEFHIHDLRHYLYVDLKI